MERITSVKEWEKKVEEVSSFYFFKNSTTCPISSEAFRQVKSYVDEGEKIPVYYLNVQESRDLSNHIAADTKVKHESPQLLYLQNGSVNWNISHSEITLDAMNKK